MRSLKFVTLLVFCLFPLFLEAQPCILPPPGLVNWWTFDEASGPSLDRAGTRNHGNWNGAPVSEQRPEPDGGRALCFQNAGDFVSVPDHDEVDIGAEDFTIAFWVRSDSPVGVQVVADKRVRVNGKVHGYSLFLHKGRPGIQLANGGYDNYIAPDAINDGAWHFVAFMVRRTADGGRILIDESTRLIFTPRTGTLQNDAPLTIGKESAGFSSGDTRLRGCVDELQVYRFTALDDVTVSMLAKHYRLSCKITHPPAPADLVAWWRFDEPWGGAARDSQTPSGAHNISRANTTTCPGISGTGIRPSQLGSVGGSDASITFGLKDFSVLLWVRSENASLNSGRRVLVDKGGTGKTGWQLIVKDGKLGISLNGKDYFGWEPGQPNVNDEQWHLVGASVFELSSSSPGVSLWVYSDTSQPFESSFPVDPADLTSTASLRVGGSIVPKSAFNGCYDELHLSASLMNSPDVQAIHKARTHGEEKP